MLNTAGKLYIEKPYIEKVNDKSRLCARCHIDNFMDEVVWYEVDSKWETYLCYERADAFILNFLMYAMENQLDIISEAPMSEKLHYQLTGYFIPSVSKWIKKYQPIDIDAPISSQSLNLANAVGTAMSGGVDSFYTVYKHLDIRDMTYRLSHLTFFNAGACGEYGGTSARNIYQQRIDWIRSTADDFGLPLITVDTNINEILMEVHIYTVSNRALAMVLALQKLFSVYYWSSAHSFMEFEFDEGDMEPYDLLNVHCFSTEDVSFYNCGGEALRIDKEEYISQFELPRKKLNVCIEAATNCSRCDKCKRTMLGLYTIGKLDLYKDVFDLDYFYEHKNDVFLQELKNKKTWLDWWEVYDPLTPEMDAVSDVNMKKMYINEFEQILHGHKVVLRGNGLHTKELIRLFPRRREIACIWDISECDEKMFGGYHIVHSLDEIRKLGADTIFVSTYTWREEIKKELAKYQNEFHVIDLYDQLKIKMDKPFYFYDFR